MIEWEDRQVYVAATEAGHVAEQAHRLEERLGRPAAVTLVVLRPGRVDAADTRWSAQLADLADRVARWARSTVACRELDEGDVRVPDDLETGSVLTAVGQPSASLRAYAKPSAEEGAPATVEPARLQAVPWADTPGT
jgi:hypothetical protein